MRHFVNIYSIFTNNHKGQYLQKLTKIIYHNTQITILKKINPKIEKLQTLTIFKQFLRRFATIYSIITNNHKGQYLQKLTKIIYHNTQITTLNRINPKRERKYKL